MGFKDVVNFQASSSEVATAAEELQKIMQPGGFHSMSAEAVVELGKVVVAIARKQKEIDDRLEKLERDRKSDKPFNF